MGYSIEAAPFMAEVEAEAVTIVVQPEAQHIELAAEVVVVLVEVVQPEVPT